MNILIHCISRDECEQILSAVEQRSQ